MTHKGTGKTPRQWEYSTPITWARGAEPDFEGEGNSGEAAWRDFDSTGFAVANAAFHGPTPFRAEHSPSGSGGNSHLIAYHPSNSN